MNEITRKELCTGCSACINVCPQNCIYMKEDDEGFLYPVIDNDRCVDCKLCVTHCPCNREKKDIALDSIGYACYSKDNVLVQKSSSGGVFGVFARYFLSLDGSVYGAAWNEKFELQHMRIDKIEELDRLLKSKYVQSDIRKIYSDVKRDLDNDKYVLFSGTPCQIAGVLTYLGRENPKLFCVDFVCHGVPSPGIWKKYLEEIAEGRNIKAVDFRSKREGWKEYALSIKFDDGKCFYEKAGDNIYMQAFLKDMIVRPACSKCLCRGNGRQSDITIADYWGVWNVEPDMYNRKGVSLVFVNSDKGKEKFSKIADFIKWKKTDIEEAVRYNSAVIYSSKQSPKREAFFEEYKNTEGKNIVTLLTNYTKENTFIKWLKWFLSCVKVVLKI